ncbi:MAG: hypothetical protein ABSH05_27460 [Bryobacteraceae bacterium]
MTCTPGAFTAGVRVVSRLKGDGRKGLPCLALLGLWATPLCAADPPEPWSIARTCEIQLDALRDEIVTLAEAMPADKYQFKPVQGEFPDSRTFAELVSHVGPASLETKGAYKASSRASARTVVLRCSSGPAPARNPISRSDFA